MGGGAGVGGRGGGGCKSSALSVQLIVYMMKIKSSGAVRCKSCISDTG